MKKSILISLAVIVIVALLGLTPFPVEAKADKITLCNLQTDVNVIYGTSWFTDNGTVLHMRGQTTYSTIAPLPGHPECDTPFSNASAVMEVNYDVNMLTGEGASWGYTTLTPTGFAGSFQGPFVGKIEGGMFQGISVTHGTGALEGLINKVTIQQVSSNTYECHGYILGQQR